mmetsp:Transcript_482/g.1400  ORF Transcript_482/g.1400 Transcript_482/m.1400 type:complete len:230 (+) Transcript_482:1473-2162(+)
MSATSSPANVWQRCAPLRTAATRSGRRRCRMSRRCSTTRSATRSTRAIAAGSCTCGATEHFSCSGMVGGVKKIQMLVDKHVRHALKLRHSLGRRLFQQPRLLRQRMSVLVRRQQPPAVRTAGLAIARSRLSVAHDKHTLMEGQQALAVSHRHIRRTRLAQGGVRLALRCQVQRTGGLIKQRKRGSGQEQPRERQALLLAQRQHARPLGNVLQAVSVQQLGEPHTLQRCG